MRALGHFWERFGKKTYFCESLRAQKGCHTIPLGSILAQKGATAANKTFAPASLGGGPRREGIRFQGNVLKIEFLEALSPYVWAVPKPLHWPVPDRSKSLFYTYPTKYTQHHCPLSKSPRLNTSSTLCLFKKPQQHHSKIHHRHTIYNLHPQKHPLT